MLFWRRKKKVDGLIAFYGLQDWWLKTFTEQEREYIDNRYTPLGSSPHSLTKGQMTSFQPTATFLNGLLTYFRAKEDSSIAQRIRQKMENPDRATRRRDNEIVAASVAERKEAAATARRLGLKDWNKVEAMPKIEQAGHYNGRHFTTYVEEVRDLKRQAKYDEAERLLLRLVEANEAESAMAVKLKAGPWKVAPWYYEELAKIYRKRKEYAREVAILERYFSQTHGATKDAKFEQRLQKAKTLAESGK